MTSPDRRSMLRSPTGSSRRSSPAESVRSTTSGCSSRSAPRSPTSQPAQAGLPRANNFDVVPRQREEKIIQQEQGPCIVYVRETFQILNLDPATQQPPTIPMDIIRSISTTSMPPSSPPPQRNNPQRLQEADEFHRSVSPDQEDRDQVNSKDRDIEVQSASREEFEKFLSSLRQGRDVTSSSGGEGQAPEESVLLHQEGVEDREDLDDSARAESIVSITSTGSLKSKEAQMRPEEEVRDPISTIRRQSVIIEGLSLEAEELKKKVINLEDELSTVPVVEEISGKLGQMEAKLEETESFCYQVVEENVGLKTEIETLESEISEVQDTFREKDAKEFKRVKWELENLAKTCRNLQIKLSKSQAKAARLRLEKEEADERKAASDRTVWKTTAVVAAAIIAGIHVLSGKLK